MKLLTDLLGFARSLGSERRQVAAQLEVLRQQRDYLLTAALPKSDVMQRLSEYLDSEAGALRRNLQKQVPLFSSHPEAHPAKIGGGPSILRCALSGKLDERLVLAIIADIAKDKIAQVMETLDWPEAGPPYAERQLQLKTLNRDIDKLAADLTELNKSAEAVKGEV